jgi:hypothetical protein
MNLFCESQPSRLIFVVLCLGVVFILLTIVLQELRSKLVLVLTAARSSLASEISDLTANGGITRGYYVAFRREFIFGSRAAEIERVPQAATLLPWIRLVIRAQQLARVAAMCAFLMFAGCWVFTRWLN